MGKTLRFASASLLTSIFATAWLSGCRDSSTDLVGNDPNPIVKKVQADAGADTTVTVGDSVVLRGRTASGSGGVKKWEWDIGNKGAFAVVTGGDTVIQAGSSPEILENVLRVTGEAGDTDLDTMIVTVLGGPLQALAGEDTIVTPADSVWLRGEGKGGSGSRYKLEWDIGGSNAFQAVSGDTLIVVDKRAGFQFNILRVTDDSGHVALDTMRVTMKDDLPVVHLKISDRLTASGGAKYLEALTEDMGRIVEWEWDLGEGSYSEGKRDTVFFAMRPDGDTLLCKIRVTDDDGNQVADSLRFVKSHWMTGEKVAILADGSSSGNPVVGKSYTAAGWQGKVFQAGFIRTGVRDPYGSISNSRFRNNAASYDPVSKTWKTEVPLPLPIFGNRLVDFKGTLLSIGGRSAESPAGVGLVYEYTPGYSDWYERRNMPKGLQAGAAAVYGGSIYYFGFMNVWNDVAFDKAPPGIDAISIYRYDAETDVWTPNGTAKLPRPITGGYVWRILGAVAGPDGIYVVFSSDYTRHYLYRYLPDGNEWAEVGYLDEMAQNFGVAAMDGEVFLLGGNAGEAWDAIHHRVAPANLKEMFTYGLDTHAWKLRSGPNLNHYNASPVVVDGVLYDLSDDFTLEIYAPSGTP
jgi:hypothetical protein